MSLKHNNHYTNALARCTQKWARFIGAGVVFLGVTTGVLWAEDGKPTREQLKEIEGLFREWCQQINTAHGKVDTLLKMYAPNAMVLPPMPTKLLLKEGEGIGKYYEILTKLPNIKCEVNNISSKIYNKTWAVNNGEYTISYTDPLGGNAKQEYRSRFSIVYQKQTDKWLIVNQTLSVLPDIEEN